MTTERKKGRSPGWSIVLAMAIAGLATIQVGVASGAAGADLAAVRVATAAFHGTDVAADAGYEPLLDCIDDPGVGGMGQHLADLAAFDATVDARHPEALVYEVRKGTLRLVGVEYIVPQNAWTGAEAPTLFGESFHRNDVLGIWALHAWIWRANPAGVFEDFNPNVKLCP